MTFRRPTLLVAAALLAAPAAAHASPDRFVIRGAGFGHGVGMSQYGALGYAIHGAGYRDILGHYYTGTGLGRLTSTPTVRVLLSSTRRTATFAGADRVGDRALTPSRTYGVRGRADGALELLSPKRRRLAVLTGPLRVTGPAPLWTGARAYRGALELSAGPGGGVDVVNAVDLESYLQGVVPAESPATWPAEALKAQAVAARSYAVTTGRGGALFDQYADTRSQVYAGVGVETAATNAAVAATRGEVVTYGGRPVTTFFFSTSGGRTEDVENTPLGHTPLPWLRSVPDPYDNVSPRHRWRPAQMTLKQAGAKLRGLVRGRFVGIRVVQRGASPRVVAADVLGTRGAVRVTGGTLRARLGLLDANYLTTV
jgi:stage II sporulation protein D